MKSATAIELRISEKQKDVLVYDTRVELCQLNEKLVRGESGGSSLMKLLLTIPGVVEVHIFPYQVFLRKGSLFEVEEVDCPVKEVLMMYVQSQKRLKDACDKIGKAIPEVEDQTSREEVSSKCGVS